MAMRRGNGQGSVIKDKSGRRRKPFRARVTLGWEVNMETGKVKQVFAELGTFATRKEADKALVEYLDKPFDVKKMNMTFSEVYEEWYEYFMSEGNESYEYRIKSAYKYCSELYNKRFREISIIDMEKCIKTGYVIGTRGENKGKIQLASPQTKVSMKFLFNRMYEYAVKARYVDRNYAYDFRLNKSVERQIEEQREEGIPFTDEDINKLWENLDIIPFVDMVLYACYSGWRAGELRTLLVENVDLEKGTVKGGIKTEAGKGRIVPIHPKVLPIIEKRLKEAELIDSPYLFNDTSKKKIKKGISYDILLNRFKEIVRRLDLNPEYTPHDTRHTFSTRAKLSRIDDTVRKMFMGHKITDITEDVYTHYPLEVLIEEMNKYK